MAHGHGAPQHDGQDCLARDVDRPRPGPRALQHELRVVYRHIGHDETGQRDLRRLEADAHGRGAGDGCRGERRQRDRRGEIGHDAEIEHEHMADDQRHAELEQRRRCDRTGDDVVRDGGDAHAEDQAHQHGQQQRGEQTMGADVDDESGEAGCRAREGEHADDDADDGAGNADRQCVPRPVDQAVAQRAQGVAPAVHEQGQGDEQGDDAEHGHDAELQEGRRAQAAAEPEHGAQRGVRDARRDGGAEQQDGRERQPHHAGEHGCEAVEQHPHQHGQRQRQVPAFLQRLPRIRALFGRQAQQLLAPGFEVHHPERREVIEHGGDDGRFHDVGIRHVEGLGHDEGHRAHDRGHDLPAHAGGGLDGAGEHRGVAEPRHQRNGELAHGQHIGHARAGDGAHQPGRQHRHLGRSSTRAPHQTQGEGVEQPDHARVLQEHAEQDEQKNVSGRHQGRNAVDPFRAEVELADDLVDAVAAVAEAARQVLSEQAIEQEDCAHERQSQAQAAPRGLEQQDDGGGADHEVERGRIARALDQFGLENPVIQAQREGRAAQCPVEPGRVLLPALGSGGGDHPVDQQQQETHMQRAHHEAGQWRECRDDELVNRERQGRDHHRDPGLAAQAALVSGIGVVGVVVVSGFSGVRDACMGHGLVS